MGSRGWCCPGTARLIYSPETYFSRGTRGVRTDVVTLYDAGTLEAVGEIPIPPKRSSNLPMIANAVLTDDERFLLIYNFNPGQSVTVVDTKTREVAARNRNPGLRAGLSDRTALVLHRLRRRLPADGDPRRAGAASRSGPSRCSHGADPVTEKRRAHR